MMKRLRALWNRLSIYLPIMLMGLFALATLWLIRSTPSVIEAVAKRPAAHEADYFLRNFSIKTFDAKGRLKAELFGSEAQHFPDTETLEIERVRSRSIDARGLVTAATSDRAISDAEGTDVQLLGNVRVIRDPAPGRSGNAGQPIEYRSEFLHVFSEKEKMKTHLPVVVSQGTDRLSGNAMSYDNVEEILELTGQVRGILNPRKAP